MKKLTNTEMIKVLADAVKALQDDIKLLEKRIKLNESKLKKYENKTIGGFAAYVSHKYLTNETDY